MDDIAEDVMTWTDGAVIVGHNVRVEVDIIKRSIPDWGPVAAIDTLRLAKILLPGQESYGLESWASPLATPPRRPGSAESGTTRPFMTPSSRPSC